MIICPTSPITITTAITTTIDQIAVSVVQVGAGALGKVMFGQMTLFSTTNKTHLGLHICVLRNASVEHVVHVLAVHAEGDELSRKSFPMAERVFFLILNM